MPMEFLVRRARGLKIRDVSQADGLSKFLNKVMERKAGESFSHIGRYLKGSILDVGLGAGTLARYLILKGYKVTGVDIVDLSMYEDLKPIITDGKRLPFKDKQFDTALLISVLHHCGENQLAVLKEAKRVSKRLIIIEDTFRNKLERAATALSDRICNLEFFHHEYRSTKEWKEIVRKNGWKMVKSREWSQFAFGLLYARYCLLVIE